MQIGGYLTQYDGLSFLTIRSAGHQVLPLFSSFIQHSITDMHVGSPKTECGICLLPVMCALR